MSLNPIWARASKRKYFVRNRLCGQLYKCIHSPDVTTTSIDKPIVFDSPFPVNTEKVGRDKLIRKEAEAKVVKNVCNIQMISDELHKQIFPNVSRTANLDVRKLSSVKQHLESHHLWGQSVSTAPEINIPLPLLEGDNIDSHFREIAEKQTRVYRNGLEKIVKGIPAKPSNWVFREGWTKYSENIEPQAVPYPEGDAFVFDIEVCQDTGQVPTLAVAVSPDAWYSWCSTTLVDGLDRSADSPIRLEELIPFDTCKSEGPETSKFWKPKIIIGHNVCYDRARIKEQYFLQDTKTRFLDTMSMHIAVSGITSFQRALKLTAKKNANNDQADPSRDITAFEWNETSSLNNLKDVYQLYCKGSEIQKEERNIFVTGKIPEIRRNFQSLASYCARDVEATHEILVKLLPLFLERFPHPVTFAGTLEMGTTYLPINESWTKYIQNSDKKFDDMQKEVKSILMQKAKEALSLLDGERYKNDPWLWDLDWKIPREQRNKNSKLTEIPAGSPKWYRSLFYKVGEEDYQPGPAKISTAMRVVPKLLRLCWFGCPLYHSKTGGWGFLVKKVESANLQGVRYNDPGCSETLGGTEENIVVSQFPYKQWEAIWDNNRKILEKKYDLGRSANTVKKAGAEMKDKSAELVQDLRDFVKGLDALTTLGLRTSISKKSRSDLTASAPHPLCEFRPLPHKDGGSYRVGNPLAKDFLNKIEDNILTSADGGDVANKVVTASKMLTYWRNNRDRIRGQIAVWLKTRESSKSRIQDDSTTSGTVGAILPQVVVSGTLTRRAVEPTWMTASNAYIDRVGSELKGFVQAPDGYHFVGADVDSQELWIASVIGDSNFAAVHGCTAIGWMTLQGNKSAGTDMHSKTASLIGIDRDQAKVLNYGRIYGAGVRFAERLLLQFNPKMSPENARTKSRAMYSMTKGQHKYLLNTAGQELAQNVDRFREKAGEPLTRQELNYLLRNLQHPQNEYMDLVDKIIWDGGTESHMFNRLEEIAQHETPETPILHCQISRSLVPATVQEDFMTSRVNWVVQSSAVDYLHLMLTSMRWLFEKYNIDGRFAISVHDEVRYLVASKDKYRAALALQITNLFTRAMCSHQLGMNDLPQSVAFFSCVDIDKVLRKEVTQDCKTPSNPDGLWKGHGIPNGEALNIYELLKKTGSTLKHEEY
ncbi:unnamed protein product [Allacma fusca]|uniref:DNA polymerase subunit gamma-1 n=1 Tax=Allacma fusca TaxID=39272 RepID=A0A8J2JD06_9HEXA|nr:unnamed protein product [Allacma fusca]